MKRGFPQKIKPLQPIGSGRDSSSDALATEHYSTSAKLEAASRTIAGVPQNCKASLVASEAPHQSVIVANALAPNRTRRARTSAAMVGLAALSMGAADLSSLWNTKGALAADDSVATEPLRRFSEDDPEPSSLDFSTIATQTPATPAVQPLGASFSGVTAATIEVDPAMAEVDGLGTEGRMTHVVVAGETWDELAERYGITPQALAMANALPLSSNLSPGQILRIPAIGEFPASEAAQDFTDVPLVSTPPATAPMPVAFLPELGEAGAEQPEQILAMGGQAPVSSFLKGDLETLKADASPKATPSAREAATVIAAAAPTTAAPHWELSDLIPYRVQPGDTLDKIARDHAVPRTALMEVNNLHNPNLLVVNQLLAIPRAGQTELTASSLGLPQFAEVHGVASDAPSPEAQTLAGVFSAEAEAAGQAAVLVPETPSTPTQIAGLGTPNAPQVETAELPVVPIVGIATPSPDLDVVAVPSVPRVAPAMVAQPAVPSAAIPQATDPLVVATGSLTATPAEGLYAVQPGDTLFSIARQHGISVWDLAQQNRITDPNRIFVSQRLSIPDGVSNGGLNLPATASVTPAATTVASSTLNPGLGYNLTPGVSPETQSPGLSSPNRPVTQPQASEFSPHIQGLLSEIEALRAKYRTGSTPSPVEAVAATPAVNPAAIAAPTVVAAPVIPSPEPAPVATTPTMNRTAATLAAPIAEPAPEVALLSVNERVNPEFRSPSTATIETNVGVLDPLQNRAPQPAAPVLSAEEQLLAAAPIGAENYDPLVQSLLGQQVSPQLPPVGADPFLPDSVVNGFIWPAQGMLTSGYGWRWGRMHKGIDIAAPVGTPIVAAAGGVVSYAGWNSGGYGNLVEIQHPDGSVTLYAHNSRILVQEGQRVSQGQRIADMGSTGYSTGPHLHFEIHPSGQGAVNPMAYLPR